MKVGSLRHRITLQQLVEVKDSVGQMIESWLDQGTYWAYLETISGPPEVINAHQVQDWDVHAPSENADTSDRCRCRNEGLLVSWRFVFQGRIFNILMVDKVKEIKKEYRIMAQETASVIDDSSGFMQLEDGSGFLLLENSGRLLTE